MDLKKTLSKFENQILMDKLDSVLKLLSKLDKRVADLEEINLNYLSIIEQMSDSLGILTGEVLQEVEKQEKVENLLSLPSSKKGNYEN
ncbi:MAG TPA: hypothetical protein PLP33_16285 [Leptospiraceae bacterium]|nr:hypothetical protein [Leptospiraceae bacterium]